MLINIDQWSLILAGNFYFSESVNAIPDPLVRSGVKNQLLGKNTSLSNNMKFE